MTRFLVILFVCISFISLSAQQDSISVDYSCSFREIIHYAPPAPVDYANENLSSLLGSSITPLVVKNYGAGNLATITMRGSSASQTAVNLDGFNIQSNMNGVYDLTLIPAFFLESIYVNPSSGSADLNGGIGGNLGLVTDSGRRKKEKYSLGLDYGSYNDISVYGGLTQNWGKENDHQSRLKVLYRQAENDYPYTNNNVAGTPREKLPNAAFRQWGFTQQNLFSIGKNKLKTNTWYVNHDREIPPTATQNTSTATQQDELFQGIISWIADTKIENFDYKITGRYAYEQIIYNSPGINSNSKGIKFNLRPEFNYKIENNRFSLISEYEYSQAKTANYDLEKPNRNRFILLGNYNKEWNFNALDISVREEFIDNYFSPFLFDIKYKQHFDFNSFYLDIKPRISRNFQLPTFNDLFWAESAFSIGNPNLEPEKNWKEELGIRLQHSDYGQKTYTQSSLSINLFNSNTNNWILWSPNDFGRWSPRNVKKVWARGIEINGEHEFIKKNHKYSLEVNYSFIKTTNQEKGSPSDGKQLIYTPQHQGNISLGYSYKKYNFYYSHQFMGSRFTALDNSAELPFYQIGSFTFETEYKIKSVFFKPRITINNIFNTEYFVVDNRPMPPTNFKLGLFIQFK